MRRLKIIFICKLTICLLTWSVFVAELDALRGSAVVLQARAKADKKNSDPDEAAIDVDENGEQVELNVTTTTKPTLTGIPQIDYVHDPNLPRELNGYNLTDYPFLNSVPEEIEFKCDGLHDGFYASIPHKCQLYHHCLFGTRFDFLCANYTAFDQKTFICHFVSQVDCPNSAKYFSRNDALYKAAETTTLPTTTTSTTAAPQQQQQQQQQPQQQLQQQQPFYPQYQQQQMPYEGRRAIPPGYAQGRKRRPTYRRRRPVYEYYYVDDYDDQQEYYDDSVEHMPVVKKPIRKHSRFNNYKQADLEADYQESSLESDAPPSGNFKQHRGQQHGQQQQQQPRQQQQQQPSSSTAVTKNVSNQISSVYDKPRAPPKIRRPVPINERDRYDYTSSVSKSSGPQPGPSAPAAAPASTTAATTTTSTTTTEAAPAKSAAAGSRAREPQRPTSTEDPVEYYDDDEEVVADDEYAAEPEVPAAVKSAVAAAAAASKPDQAKPVKVAAARTAAVQVVDYDADRVRRPPAAAAVRTKPISRAPATVAPPPPPAAAPRRRPAADRVADEYEDELPAAATRQSIAAATKQRASGPFLSRPSKPTKAINRQPAADAEDGGADEPAEPVVVYQQARQPQRVSVRQVMAAGSHGNNNRHRPQQQQAAAATQYSGSSKQHAARATSAANRMRPAMRPVYEYADEYYDE